VVEAGGGFGSPGAKAQRGATTPTAGAVQARTGEVERGPAAFKDAGEAEARAASRRGELVRGSRRACGRACALRRDAQGVS
jgi:hypothetical protein